MTGDEDYVAGKRVNRVYFSREFQVNSDGPGRSARYVSRVFEGVDREHFAEVQGEVVLRVTRAGRQQIKAFFLVDDRKIRTLTLQRFSADSGTLHEEAHFSLQGDEIQKLLDLALLIRTAQFEGQDKVRLEEGDLDSFRLTKGAARALLKTDPKMLAELVEREITERDIVTIAYRREQLALFERLLRDDALFEGNPWIFGYGLFYIFTSGFDQRKLEQAVAGAYIGGAGKRTDALLRTRGIVSALCFVEIKTHRTALVDVKPYRSDVWAPSSEVTSAVAQIQKTVESAERAIGRKLEPKDELGNPTGESAFVVRPRSVVVVGNLDQFVTPTGVNESKFTSFELFRRHLVAPEVITFDELHQRARFIVDSTLTSEEAG